MLGYIKNKSNIYNTNSIDRLLENAVSFSGGTQQHFNIFKNILSYSLWNRTANIPLHDTRAAQHLLFLYPLRIQVFLSLIFYKQDLIVRNSFSDIYDIENNIIRPEEVLRLNSVITRNYLSIEVIQLFNIINDDIILTDDYLSQITEHFSLNKSINSLNTNLREAIINLFNIFNINNPNNETFLDVAIDNDRVRSIDTIARYLNYKQRSRTILSQAVNQWQHQTSST